VNALTPPPPTTDGNKHGTSIRTVLDATFDKQYPDTYGRAILSMLNTELDANIDTVIIITVKLFI
jgi:hypothetical protein